MRDILILHSSLLSTDRQPVAHANDSGSLESWRRCHFRSLDNTPV
jgi:hypothetical protein